MFDIVFHNFKIVSSKGFFYGDVGIRREYIEKVSSSISVSAKVEIDGKGLTLLPGLIDCHVHLREPGFTEAEDFYTGTMSALYGGITTLLDMPNNNPPTISKRTLLEKIKSAKTKSLCDVFFYIGATESNIKEILEMEKEGIPFTAIKVFLSYHKDEMLFKNLKLLKPLFEKSKKTIAFHCEDNETIIENEKRYKDFDDPLIHQKIRSPLSSLEAVQKVIELVSESNHKIHICHISTKDEIEILKEKKRRLPISIEVTPNHLFLIEDAHYIYKNFVKLNPPLRSKEDMESLWKELNEKTIDIIATDHAPHTIEAKKRNYFDSPSGIPGLDTLLPLLIKSVNEGKMKLEEIALFCAENPAKIFNLEKKGEISEGYYADIVIIDDKDMEPYENKNILSKSGWSPYTGWVLGKKPKKVYYKGHLRCSLH